MDSSRRDGAGIGPATAIHSVTNEARPSPAEQTPNVSCARCRSTSNAGAGSIRAVLKLHSNHRRRSSLSLARRLSPTTQETYRRDLERYVLPRFGSYRLGRPPTDEIENWLNDEVAGGLAASSVHRHYRVLRRMLHVAVEKQRIPSNPGDRVAPPRIPKREMVFLTWDQTVDLAEAHTERYRALIYLAVDSGMRWSELVGLRRGKLDLRLGKVRVTEQLIRLSSREWLRKEPKTPSATRSITIAPVTVEVLAEHVERFSGQGPDGLVFANSAG
ncbi:MAG: tyrosine-type recombinase/integrase, partial [Acidimicrobiales bacterium]